MSLENLLKTKQLQLHHADDEALRRMLDAIRRNLADAQVAAVSGETRFDAAYKAILQCAMLGLWLHGYRTSTSQPGHHQTAIQALSITLEIDKAVVIVLEALRKQRNISDYQGDPVSDEAVIECIKQAETLSQQVLAWIQMHRPELIRS